MEGEYCSRRRESETENCCAFVSEVTSLQQCKDKHLRKKNNFKKAVLSFFTAVSSTGFEESAG